MGWVIIILVIIAFVIWLTDGLDIPNPEKERDDKAEITRETIVKLLMEKVADLEKSVEDLTNKVNELSPPKHNKVRKK